MCDICGGPFKLDEEGNAIFYNFARGMLLCSACVDRMNSEGESPRDSREDWYKWGAEE